MINEQLPYTSNILVDYEKRLWKVIYNQFLFRFEPVVCLLYWCAPISALKFTVSSKLFTGSTVCGYDMDVCFLWRKHFDNVNSRITGTTVFFTILFSSLGVIGLLVSLVELLSFASWRCNSWVRILRILILCSDEQTFIWNGGLSPSLWIK